MAAPADWTTTGHSGNKQQPTQQPAGTHLYPACKPQLFSAEDSYKGHPFVLSVEAWTTPASSALLPH